MNTIVKPYICSECGEPCDGEMVDQGIGSYEFWGQKGRDVRMAFVSECCEAEVHDENGNEVDPPEPEYGGPEYE